MKADELLKAGRLNEALAALQQQVRDNPADAKLRVFLFQLLSVLGQWDRALTQLNVAAEVDAKNLLLAEIGRNALAAEAFRAEVFAGRRQPLVFGQPAEWVGFLIQSNQLAAEGKTTPRASCVTVPSRRRRQRPARSTASPSSGFPTATCASGPCLRR